MTDISKKTSCEEKPIEAYLEYAQKIRSLISSEVKDCTDAFSFEENMPDSTFLVKIIPDIKVRPFSLKYIEFNLSKGFNFWMYLVLLFSLLAGVIAIVSTLAHGFNWYVSTFALFVFLGAYIFFYSCRARFKKFSKKLHENVDVILSMAPILCDRESLELTSLDTNSVMLSCLALRNGETLRPRQIFILCITMLDISDEIKKTNSLESFNNIFCEEMSHLLPPIKT